MISTDDEVVSIRSLFHSVPWGGRFIWPGLWVGNWFGELQVGGIYSLALVNSQVDHPAPSPSPPALACWIVLAARSQYSSTAKASERAYQKTTPHDDVTNVRPERHWPMGPLADASGPLRPRDVKACESNGGGQVR